MPFSVQTAQTKSAISQNKKPSDLGGSDATACGNSAVFKSLVSPGPDYLKIRGFPSPVCAGFGSMSFPDWKPYQKRCAAQYLRTGVLNTNRRRNEASRLCCR